MTYTYDRLGRQKVAQTFLSAHHFSYDSATLALTNETVIAHGATNTIARAQDNLAAVGAEGVTLELTAPEGVLVRNEYGVKVCMPTDHNRPFSLWPPHRGYFTNRPARSPVGCPLRRVVVPLTMTKSMPSES